MHYWGGGGRNEIAFAAEGEDGNLPTSAAKATLLSFKKKHTFFPFLLQLPNKGLKKCKLSWDQLNSLTAQVDEQSASDLTPTEAQ